MANGLIEMCLDKRYGAADRAEIIEAAFPDVNPEAISRAILNHRGNFPPYPKDIEVMVYQYDIDGMFQRGIRNLNGITKEEQLSRIRKGIMEDIA